DDTLTGGAGDDVITGGAGADTVVLSGSRTQYDFDLNPDGTVRVTDSVAGRDGVDTLSGIEKIDFLGETGADFTLRVGTGGDDTFTGNGRTVFVGGDGVDTVDFSAKTGRVDVGLDTQSGGYQAHLSWFEEIENVTGGSGNDNLSGDDGANRLEGGAGNDNLRGRNGDDALVGGAGNDSLRGDGGTDAAVYAGAANDYLVVDNGDGTFTVTDQNTGDGLNEGVDTLRDIENLTFSDGTISLADAVDDTPTDISIASGGSVAENAANPTVVASLATTDADSGESFTYAITNDPSGFFEISGSNIIVKAGAALNFETATSHDVTVRVTDSAGLTYSETLTLSVTDQAESHTLANGGVTFTDTHVAETSITGGTGNDDITAHDDGGDLRGAVGNDVLRGGAGDDTLDGGAGADVAVFSANLADYTITESGGAFTVAHDSGGADGTDTVTTVETFRFADGDAAVFTGGAGGDTQTGGAGVDIMAGGDGTDALDGAAGADLLLGGAWTDTLTGGAGNDTLDGGAGTDIAVFSGNRGDYAVSTDGATPAT
ncbi:MAG: calcium-binding protein, partial [Pseudomonadota bacterium]